MKCEGTFLLQNDARCLYRALENNKKQRGGDELKIGGKNLVAKQSRHRARYHKVKVISARQQFP